MAGEYAEFYRRSIAEREAFWADQARLIHWHRPFDRVLDYSRPPFAKWFVGGLTNLCHNALDRHLATRGDQKALVYISTETGQERAYSYRELHAEVVRFAAVLQALGAGKGDRVLIYMPMIAEAIFAMLACARIGAIHSVVFGGFAANSLATRIDDAKPRLIVSASCGIEVNRVIPYKPLLDGAIALSSHKPERCVILQRPQERAPLGKGRDVDWDDAMASAQPAECVPVAATDPLYILYTSGTTGIPKGVVRDN